ncbi:MAG TPA: hypothetical protein VGY57_09475, partial [Vicinamibacterales bacterium]|nr:hypothetical protein [Vicinamibacterales bacterium]
MPRTLRLVIVILAALLGSSASARTQTLVPPPTPESHVLEAKRLLGDIPAVPNTDIGKQIATLQVDFTDFASTYLTGGKAVAKSGTTGAVGTSGTIAADWRPKYASVERDLSALIGSTDPQSPDRGMTSLDPTVRKQLQDVRHNLQLFYAATMGQPGGDPIAHPAPDTTVALPPVEPSVPPAPVPVSADLDSATIAALLERMQTLVDRLTGESGKSGAVGTSGSLSKSGKIEVERQTLDELRAEIAQLKTMLNQA